MLDDRSSIVRFRICVFIARSIGLKENVSPRLIHFRTKYFTKFCLPNDVGSENMVYCWPRLRTINPQFYSLNFPFNRIADAAKLKFISIFVSNSQFAYAFGDWMLFGIKLRNNRLNDAVRPVEQQCTIARTHTATESNRRTKKKSENK